MSTPSELEARRLTAIRALQEGRSRSEVAAMLGTTHTSVSKWAERFRTGGIQDVLARPHGRPPIGRLSGRHAAEIREVLVRHLPDQVGLTGSLWTWRSVQALLLQRFGMELSRWTILRYLKDWGFQPTQMSRPAIAADDARVAFIERLPLVDADGVLFAVGGRGDAAFMACPARPGSDAGALMVVFLDRLLQCDPRALVVSGEPELFRSPAVVTWLAQNAARVRRHTSRPSGPRPSTPSSVKSVKEV